MATTNTQAQGLVLALFGASAGGHLAGLAKAASAESLAGDLSTAAGVILGKDLSSNTAFRDNVTSNLKLTGAALTAGAAWLDGQLNANVDRGVIVATAVNYLSTLTDKTSAFYDAAQSFQTTVAAAVTWSTGAGSTVLTVSDLRAQQGNVDVVAGQSFTLTTGTDTLIGTSGNDTISAANTAAKTYVDGTDMVVDQSSTDTDTLNITGLQGNLGDGTTDLTVKNIENVNINTSTTSASTIYVDKFTGVNTLTVARDNIASSVLGKGAVTVDKISAAGVKTITTGAGVTTLTTTNSTATTATEGYTVNATGVTNGVTTKGAAVVNANDVTADYTVTVDGANIASLDAVQGVTVNASKAGTVTLGGTYVVGGPVAINAAAAKTITATGASGGLTLNAAAVRTLTATALDDSGATLTIGSTYGRTTNAAVNLSGTADSTDAASLTAGGFVTLDTNASSAGQIDSLTLNASAGLTVTLTGAPLKTTLTGASDITIKSAASNFGSTTSSKTLVDNTTAGTTTVQITTGAGSNNLNISKIAADVISYGSDIVGSNSYATTVASGQTIKLDYDQTALSVASLTSKGTVNIVTGDDTLDSSGNPSGDAVVLSGGTAKFASVAKVNLTANTGSFTSSTFDAGTADLAISGSKDVTLNSGSHTALKAATIDASALTGILTAELTADSTTLVSGSGADVVTLYGSAVFSVNAGDGNNTINATTASDGSAVTTGAGDDAINLTTTSSLIVAAGAGSDTVTLLGASDSIIDGGSGSDTLAVSGADRNVAAGANFSIAGIETVSLAGGYDLSVNNKQIANNKTFALTASSGSSILNVYDADIIQGASVAIDSTSKRYQASSDKIASSNDVIDLSGVTVSTTNTPQVVVKLGQGANTVTGTTATNDVLDVSGLYGVKDNANTSTSAEISTGVVVNLGTGSINGDTISNFGTGYLGGALASAAAGTASYLYGYVNGSSHVSSDLVSTVRGIENVTGTDGKDYIVGSAVANTLTPGLGIDFVRGGAGNDSIVLTEGSDSKDTVYFESSATSNGQDAITGFVVGSGKDVLDFTAFLGASPTALVTDTDGTEETASTSITGKAIVLIDIANGQDILTASGLTTALAASGEYAHYDMTASTKAVAITYATTGANTVGYMFMLSSDSSAVITASLVGTVTVTTAIASLAATNFA